MAIALTVALAIAGTLLWLRSVVGHGLPSLPGVPMSLGVCRPSGEGFSGDPMLLGADVGASARLGDGRVVWAYGDTFRRPDGVTLTAVRNSLAIDDGHCRAVVIPPGGQEAIPTRLDGVGYWPMSVAVADDGNVSTVRVFAERVRGSERAFGFANLGPSIATFVVPDDGAPRLVSVIDLSPDNASRRNIGWGAAVARGDDGYWYIFGTANPDRSMVFGWSVRVARAPEFDLASPASWEYWDGAGWAADERQAVEVIGAIGGVSQTFSVVHRDGTWYAISKLDGDLGSDLAVWASPAPWGPYATPTTVGRIPNERDPSLLRYMPLAHPEAPTRPGTIVVSICRNSADPELLLAATGVAGRDGHPVPVGLYRPYFVTIALPPRPSQELLEAGG